MWRKEHLETALTEWIRKFDIPGENVAELFADLPSCCVARQFNTIWQLIIKRVQPIAEAEFLRNNIELHELFGSKMRSVESEAKQLDAERETLIREITVQKAAIAQLRLEEPKLAARCATNENARVTKLNCGADGVKSVQRRAMLLQNANERARANQRELHRFQERLHNRIEFLEQRVGDQQLVVVSRADSDSGGASRLVEPRSMGSLRNLEAEIAKRLEFAANPKSNSSIVDQSSASLLSALEAAFREGDARTIIECYVSSLRADRALLSATSSKNALDIQELVNIDEQLESAVRALQRAHVRRAQQSSANAARSAALENELNELRVQLADAINQVAMKFAALSCSNGRQSPSSISVSRIGPIYADLLEKQLERVALTAVASLIDTECGELKKRVASLACEKDSLMQLHHEILADDAALKRQRDAIHILSKQNGALRRRVVNARDEICAIVRSELLATTNTRSFLRLLDAHLKEVRVLRSVAIRTDFHSDLTLTLDQATDWTQFTSANLTQFAQLMSAKQPKRPIRAGEIERLIAETTESEQRVAKKLGNLATGWLDGECVTTAHNDYLDTQKAQRFYYEIPASSVFDSALPLRLAGRTYREWMDEMSKSVLPRQ